MGEVPTARTEADLIQHLRRHPLGVIPPGHVRAELHVLQRRQAGKEVEALEDETHRAAADSGPFGPRRRGQLHSGQPDRPRRRRVQCANKVEQRRLARTGRSQDNHKSGVIDMQVDLIQRLDHVIPDTKVAAHIIQIDADTLRSDACIDNNLLGFVHRPNMPESGAVNLAGPSGMGGLINLFEVQWE